MAGLPVDAIQTNNAVPSDQAKLPASGGDPAVAMSQEATARNKAHLQVVRNNAVKPDAGLHQMELVDSNKPGQDVQPKLSPEAIKQTAKELNEAIHNRNLWGYGFSSPDVEKLLNLLETMSAAD